MNKFQKKSIRLFLLGLIPVIIVLIGIFYSMGTDFLKGFNYRFEYGISADIGIAGAIVAGAGLGLFIFRRILRYLDMDEIIDAVLKLGVKIFQKFHIPLGMIAFSIIAIHVYIFIHLGFKWTIGYIFGALAAIDLLIIVISGFLRIFNKGIKSHKALGIILLILTGLHVILVK